MYELKVVLGAIAVLISIISYIPYFRDVFLGKTKPHVYTWFVWSILTGIGFFNQALYGAGAGSWTLGFVSFCSFMIFLLSLKKGEKNIVLSDKISLAGALMALVLWYFTNNPLNAVILAVVIDGLGYYPTVRKSYHSPGEETISLYFLVGLEFLIVLFALENYSLLTYLYPIFLIVINWIFVIFLIIRRKQLKKKV